MTPRLPVCGLFLVLLPASVLPLPAQGLRAGIQAVDVTPQTLPIRVSGSFLSHTADQLDGKLFARCLVLDDGSTRIAISVVDSLMMPLEMLDRVKQAASRSTGIPKDRMLISATHTHSAPPVMGALGTDAEPEYAAFLEQKIVQAITAASTNLKPASVGWSTLDVPEYTHCRRWILRPDKIRQDPFGAFTVRAHMHPGYQNPEFIGPAGPVDPQLTVLAVRSRDGQPMALLANYSMHYVGVSGKVVSPDYYGPFVENVQKALGKDSDSFIAMMSQGTSGDQHWMDYGQPKKDMNTVTYAEALASKALEAYQKIRYVDSVPLGMTETRLRLSRRVPDERRLQWAKETLAKLPNGVPTNQVEVYAREQILIDCEPERDIPLQALRIGGLAIAAFPNEVFAITGLKVKLQSPFLHTFNIELANGADGYIPPPEQHKLGGYTTWPARTAGLEPQAEPNMVEALLSMFEKLAGKQRRPITDPPDDCAKAVLAVKPVAYWRMNEIRGPEALDATGSKTRATYEDGVAFYLEGAGPGNRAPHFAGGRMKADFVPLSHRYSVSMWFWNGMPVDFRPVTGYLWARGSGDSIGIDGAGKLFLASAGQTLTGAMSIPVKTWTHVVFVRNGPHVEVYLNGDPSPEIAGKLEAPTAGSLFIGGRQDPENSFEGKIDEVAVFGKVLSSTEVQKLFAAARI